MRKMLAEIELVPSTYVTIVLRPRSSSSVSMKSLNFPSLFSFHSSSRNSPSRSKSLVTVSNYGIVSDCYFSYIAFLRFCLTYSYIVFYPLAYYACDY